MMKKEIFAKLERINWRGRGLDKFSDFAIIGLAKTTRYDPLGMAGFFIEK